MSLFNGERYLDRVLSSIESQTRQVDEIIIVDDASTDKSYSILRSWSERVPIKIITNKSNRGIAFSLNLAAASCSYQWFLRIDVDDFWSENHVEGIVDMIGRYGSQNLAIVSAQTNIINFGSISKAPALINDHCARISLMWDNPFTHSAVAINLKAFNLSGGYELNARWEDYDLWVRLLSFGELAVVDKYSCFYSVSSDSISRIPYSIAVSSRFDIQKKAIIKFFWVNPFFASLAYLAIILRLLWMKIKYKF